MGKNMKKNMKKNTSKNKSKRKFKKDGMPNNNNHDYTIFFLILLWNKDVA